MTRTEHAQSAERMTDAQLRAEAFRLPREIASRKALLKAVMRELHQRRIERKTSRAAKD